MTTIHQYETNTPIRCQYDRYNTISLPLINQGYRKNCQSTANPYLIPIPVNASDNDDGDEGDEEHVNMAMALLQKLLDGVNIYLTFFNDNLAQDPGLQDTKNRYVLKKKSRQILLREVFKSNFENFLGRICLEIFFLARIYFLGHCQLPKKSDFEQQYYC